MSKKKTDWEIARGLADWVMTLGLGECEHQKWVNGKEDKGLTAESYVKTYVNGDFVSMSITENREVVNSMNIHSTSLGPSFGLGVEYQTKEELMAKADKFLEELDIRKWNLVYRRKLKFLEANAKQRLRREKEKKVQSLKAQADALKEEIAEMEGKKKK